MNFFGHLSCLVKEIRKIPDGNQECSKMRCSITVTKMPWSQVPGHSSHWIPGTLSWTLVCKDFSGLFGGHEPSLPGPLVPPKAAQLMRHSTWLRPWGRARSLRPHQLDGVQAAGGCPDNSVPWPLISFPFNQACSCAPGFLPWPLAHLKLLGCFRLPAYPPDFKMVTRPSGAGKKRKPSV